MTGSDPTPPPRPGRLWRIALFASLALNLAFVGLIAGGVLSEGPRSGAGGPGSEMRALWRSMPEDSRQAMRERMQAEAGNDALPDRDARRARALERAAEHDAELLALLRAEEFDAEAFAGLLATRRAQSAERSEQAQALFVAQLATLDASERAAMADRYQAKRTRRHDTR